MHGPLILLPDAVASRIESCGGSWGTLTLKQDHREGLLVVSGWSRKLERNYPDPNEWSKEHFTRDHPAVPGSGFWYRAKPELHKWGRHAAQRSLPIDVERFREQVSGWRFPTESGTPLLTYTELNGKTDWLAWFATRTEAAVVDLDRFDPEGDLLAPLDEGWPRERLARRRVTIIGLGSIGGVAAEAVASYGIAHVALVDPQRLLARNFARHRALRRDHGRLKVYVTRELLIDRNPRVDVDCYGVDVGVDADVMRPLFADSDLILCCSDGPRSRRVTNHLAFRAGKPLVMASVAEFGAYGEVLRLLPGRTGCYLCNRAALGETLGLDVDLAGDYDQIGEHAPMTAVTGDLALVGQLAAKVSVATLLIGHGERDQKLTGDQAIIGLRPKPPFPEPFDTKYAGTIRWEQTSAARPDCPVCGTDGP